MSKNKINPFEANLAYYSAILDDHELEITEYKTKKYFEPTDLLKTLSLEKYLNKFLKCIVINMYYNNYMYYDCRTGTSIYNGIRWLYMLDANINIANDKHELAPIYVQFWKKFIQIYQNDKQYSELMDGLFKHVTQYGIDIYNKKIKELGIPDDKVNDFNWMLKNHPNVLALQNYTDVDEDVIYEYLHKKGIVLEQFVSYEKSKKSYLYIQNKKIVDGWFEFLKNFFVEQGKPKNGFDNFLNKTIVAYEKDIISYLEKLEELE